MSIFQFDQHLQNFIASFRIPIFDIVAYFLEVTGDNILIYATVILCLLWFKKTRKYAIYFTVSIFIAIFITTVMKHLINRPRPFVMHQLVDMLKNVRSNDHYLSFPSGHTTAVTTIAATYWIYYRKHIGYCIFAVILMAWSRIYLYMHYPIDTAVGMVIGIGVSILIYLLMNKIETKFLKKNWRN